MKQKTKLNGEMNSEYRVVSENILELSKKDIPLITKFVLSNFSEVPLSTIVALLKATIVFQKIPGTNQNDGFYPSSYQVLQHSSATKYFSRYLNAKNFLTQKKFLKAILFAYFMYLEESSNEKIESQTETILAGDLYTEIEMSEREREER